MIGNPPGRTLFLSLVKMDIGILKPSIKLILYSFEYSVKLNSAIVTGALSWVVFKAHSTRGPQSPVSQLNTVLFR